ncbi:MAG: hypothetical protein U0P45_05115 [Acidimicrobiales bacterium]
MARPPQPVPSSPRSAERATRTGGAAPAAAPRASVPRRHQSVAVTGGCAATRAAHPAAATDPRRRTRGRRRGHTGSRA